MKKKRSVLNSLMDERQSRTMRFILPCLFASIILFTLSACATGRTMVNHRLSFDTMIDSLDAKHPEVEILDYQYGSSRQFGTYADKGSISHGITFVQQSITGPMLRGEFLYVKWRVISSRQVFEDKVDLRSRLPEDIEYLNLHFVPKGSQLYVFLIYPWDGKSWEEEPLKNRFTPVPGGIRRFEGKKILQIYPDPSKQ
jgi:hypothetical protein